ncbi:HlyD family secretion protein [Halomonas denitrificans]|uniref:HlyD family secretion protein n=1 Tax=Halomonas TaxID=2745 RepID=UPI001A90097D|nr:MULTISPECIES: HlyD family secretion protein [Halomonas]MBN8411119.1 HlyD family secretion protein [Halomonas litopenaei]MBY5970569.1 HlyD family secretion protein [Halomonas denitrificans]MBY5986146.1 HlyD family secretion protein [Halomonas sp. DP5Y7-2]MBY6208359.1 HlyD family secretion protein [Halomonas sp. DP3Y7-2]MBY6229168.1 HlyD family secretion protein [Halomonas sp. DP3Y7-1]
MTPDQRFKWLVRLALGLFVLMFGYFVVADTYMPMTPEARVMRPVVRIAPEVSGPVARVDVSNNVHVEAGDVLFRLDPAPFELALEQAQLEREAARQENDTLGASIASARATLDAARARAQESRQERSRGERLIGQGSISRQRLDGLVATDRQAQAEVKAAEAEVARLEVELGAEGDANLRLRQARNAVEQARLDLEHTVVRAQHSGIISNLQLEVGDYATQGQPLVALISDELDVIADFREKSLRKVAAGDDARIVFDGLPGQVFSARVEQRDAGVRDGQVSADGNLADIPTTDRWLRDAQRLRLHLTLTDDVPQRLPTGARATVQLFPGDHPIAHPLGALQVRLMSWLHYVY